MRTKPDMKPWVNPDKSGLSSFRSGTFGASICPWECRPYRAPLRLPYHFIILMRLPWCYAMVSMKLIIFTSSFVKGDHCIIRYSLRYYRHSGLVIYMSKLPAPSVSMPCDYRILQSPTKGQVLLVLWETVGRSLKGYPL